jgi:predicted metal-dependent phosphotriesterase family hydrolase
MTADENTVRRTIMVNTKIDKKMTQIRASAMSRNNSYSYGRVLNCAMEYAIQKGFDQEQLKKISEELD